MGEGVSGSSVAIPLGVSNPWRRHSLVPSAAVADRPDLVLVLTDQQRFDWTGATSGGVFETPVLDRLALDGVRFTDAHSSSSTCIPSRTSIFTGLHHHRVPQQDEHISIRPGVWTVASALRDAGYETAAIGRMHLHPVHADVGFETMRICENINAGSGYGDDVDDDYRRWMTAEGLPDWRVWDPDGAGGLTPHLASRPRTYPADADHHPTGWIGNEAVRFLRERSRDRPLFLVVSFPHPHAPYDPPEPYASMYDPADVDPPIDGPEVNAVLEAHYASSAAAFSEFARPHPRRLDAAGDDEYRQVMAAIRGLVRHIDDVVGDVVAELDLDRSLVVMTSDHGDYGGHRGLFGKVPWIPFEDILRVPMVASGGVVTRRGSVGEVVQTGSLTATFLDAAGVAPPDADGDFPSLGGFLWGEPDPSWGDAPRVFATTTGFPCVRVGRHKLIGSTGTDEKMLFDLAADPGETRSILAAVEHDPELAVVMERIGGAFLAALAAPPPARYAGMVLGDRRVHAHEALAASGESEP